MEVLLINERLFKEYSPVKDDTAIGEFIPYVNIAQKMYIERILGLELTRELQTQIVAASLEGAPEDAITPANRALIIEIAPALSNYAVYQGAPFHWASFVNKGITIRESENSKGITVNEMAQLRRYLKDDAETLAGFLIEYLCRCRNLYPLWKPDQVSGCDCGGGDASGGSNRNNLDAGIYIPKRR